MKNAWGKMLHVPHIKALAMAYLSRTDNKDIHALQTMRNIPRIAKQQSAGILCVYDKVPLLMLTL